jgi:hypothetical protein
MKVSEMSSEDKQFIVYRTSMRLYLKIMMEIVPSSLECYHILLSTYHRKEIVLSSSGCYHSILSICGVERK